MRLWKFSIISARVCSASRSILGTAASMLRTRAAKSSCRLRPSRTRSTSSAFNARTSALWPRLNAAARVVLFLDDVKNFRPIQDRSNFRIAAQTKLLAETAQFGDVQIRQPVVHLEPHWRRLQRNRLDENFDSAARYHSLHGFANLRLVLAPSARHRQLEFKKSLVECSNFGNHASAVMLGDSPAEPGHAFHANSVPFFSRFSHTRAIERERPRGHSLHRVIFYDARSRRRAHLRSQLGRFR